MSALSNHPGANMMSCGKLVLTWSWASSTANWFHKCYAGSRAQTLSGGREAPACFFSDTYCWSIQLPCEWFNEKTKTRNEMLLFRVCRFDRIMARRLDLMCINCPPSRLREDLVCWHFIKDFYIYIHQTYGPVVFLWCLGWPHKISLEVFPPF